VEQGNKVIGTRAFWIKMRNWEYWPSMAFYWPMVIYGPLLALRYRHPCFFSAANPALYISGLGLESKFETLQMFPAHLRPCSVKVGHGTGLAAVLREMAEVGLSFPLIVKPDIGFRGLLVAKVHTPQELDNLLGAYPIDFILQEYLDYPEEVGVFYIREPGEERGKIVSLTLKTFLGVTGDGQLTVKELALQNARALLQMERLEETYPGLMGYVPGNGEEVPLGIVGNHSKGTRFINGTSEADERLAGVFDEVVREMKGFFYGRFDIKCQNLDSLKEGKDFKIIELNGIGAEPTHIYDQSRMTYPGALWTIMRHWTSVARISSINHSRGVAYLPPGKMLRALADLRTYQRSLKKKA
jgi:hypothetical protein